jgi:hypothetical protein
MENGQKTLQLLPNPTTPLLLAEKKTPFTGRSENGRLQHNFFPLSSDARILSVWTPFSNRVEALDAPEV